MGKIFTVQVIEKMLVTYEVEADDESSITQDMFLHREPNDGIREVSSEYYDFDEVYAVEEDK